MGVSKINYGPRTVMDLSKDTVTASKLLKGVTAHDKNGDQITGTYEGDGSGGTEIDKTGNGAYAWAKYSELIDYVETKESTGSSNRPSGFDYTQEYTSSTITSDGYYNLKSGGISLDKLYLPTNSENRKAKKIAYKPYGYNTRYQIWTLSDEKGQLVRKGQIYLVTYPVILPTPIRMLVYRMACITLQYLRRTLMRLRVRC